MWAVLAPAQASLASQGAVLPPTEPSLGTSPSTSPLESQPLGQADANVVCTWAVGDRHLSSPPSPPQGWKQQGLGAGMGSETWLLAAVTSLNLFRCPLPHR